METPKSGTVSSSAPQAHFLDYWRIIRIRKTVILAVFLLVLLTTVGVTLILKQTYASSVSIRVERDTKDIDPLGSRNSQLGFDPYFIATEFETIQSREVLYPVIESLDLPKKWAERYQETTLTVSEVYQILLKSLNVRQTRNTSIIEIEVESEDREEARAIAQAVALAYRQWRVNVKERTAKGGIAKLKENLNEQSREVLRLQGEVDEIRTRLMIPDSTADASSYQSSLERERLSSVQLDLIKAESEYVFWKTKEDQLKALDQEDYRDAILTAMPGEQQLPLLYTDLAMAEQSLAEMRKDLAEDHPNVQRALGRKAQIEQQIQKRLRGILIGLNSTVASYKARVDSLTNKVQEGRREVAEAATVAREYDRKKRDLENQQRIRDAILLRTLQEEVDASLPTSSIVEIINQAEIGLRPVRPNFTLNIALGVIVGLVMGVGLAFFIEYLDTSVKTIDDVERALQAPVIGVIPQNVGLLIDEGPDSPHAEAYRVLRTNVLFSRKNPEHNTITVVSGGAGEGKSTTIFNLATVFAQNGARVLVVDSDLRRPSLHKLLNLSNSIGLTNYLLKQNSLEEVVQTTKMPSLDFLPSGKLPSSSMGLLNSARMTDFVKDVKRRYDFVFFDSPPIMGVSDASILASSVDLAVLVVQYRKYPQAINVRAKQMVEKVGGNLLGVVLNNINISQDSYYYYYSGYYYDYYSRDEDSKEPKKRSGEKVSTEESKVVELKRKY